MSDTTAARIERFRHEVNGALEHLLFGGAPAPALSAIAMQPLRLQGFIVSMVLSGAMTYEDGCRAAGYDIAYWKPDRSPVDG